MGFLVSVIVPVYNVEQYLDVCVNSIINQTYKNLEIILVDDGSTDASETICDEWALKDDRIKVIHKENGGLSDARNTGMRMSEGEYIFFVDSDDYIKGNAIEELVCALERDNADIVIADSICFNDGEDVQESAYFGENKLYNQYQAAEHYASLAWSAWNKLYRRDVHISIEFPVGRIHEDEAIMFYLIANSQKILHIGQQLYYYRKRKGSITEQEYSIKKMDWYYCWKNNIEYVINKFPNAYEQVLDKWLMVSIYNIDNLLRYNKSETKKYIIEIQSTIKKYSWDIFNSRKINLKKKVRALLLSGGNIFLYKKIYKI